MNIRVADWAKAIIVTGAAVLLFLIAGRVYNTIQLLIGGVVIAYLLSPIVSFFEEKKAHRYIAILLAYIVFIAALALGLAVIVPLIAAQIRGFVTGLPVYVTTVQEQLRALSRLAERTGLSSYVDIDPQVVTGQLTTIIAEQLGNVVALIPPVLGFIVEGFLVLFISLYVLLAIPMMHRSIKRVLPDARDRDVYDRFNIDMRMNLNRYLTGLALVMMSVGILAGIAYWIVGLPYPLLLGIWAGITEVIPYLGPALGVIPALIIALTISPTTALVVLGVFAAIQALESVVLSPAILGSTNKLNPLVIILSLLAGAELGGIIGLLLSVPIVVFIASIIGFAQDNFEYVRSTTGPDRIKLRQRSPAGEPEGEGADRNAGAGE